MGLAMRIVRCIAFLAALLMALDASSQPDIFGEVIAIADGDTMRLLTAEKSQVKIRLAEIDTPERGQPYASRAREALAELVFRKPVRVVYVDTDRYGRTVGRVYVGDLDVNAELVRRGAAWVYRKYARDESLYRLEDEARSARRGIWSLPEVQRMPPWEWRRGKRAAAAPVGRSEPAAAGFECGSKTYCREMRSCQEALFHLNECGLARIDSDDDGMPCEKICR